MKIVLFFTISIFLIGVIYFIYTNNVNNNPGTISSQVGITSRSNEIREEGPDVEILAENLEIPWEIAFLPNGDLLATERPGRLVRIGNDRSVIEISGVRHVGEGGLLGLALHPNFDENKYIYLYLTGDRDGRLENRVERYRFSNDLLSDREIVIEGIDGAPNHDGGRIEFGPDGKLYVTTGDAQQTNLAQITSSLNGKILRINDDGSIPEDNPFGNAVYSYGHRNVQGIAWDDDGRLWATEHGRSGVLSGFDEVNLIEVGNNYGWPEIQGSEQKIGMTAPIIHSGASETWAPGDIEYLNGSLFFSGLRGRTLYEAKLNGRGIVGLTKHFSDEFGRLRAVRLAPDGILYVTTSNRDGRGEENSGDDKLIKINPRIF